MGLFNLGDTLSFNESQKYQHMFKKTTTTDFIKKYQYYHNIWTPTNRFGEELEYTVIKLRDNNQTTILNCNEEIIKNLNNNTSLDNNTKWFPEYGGWMIEGVTNIPYDTIGNAILYMEAQLLKRRLSFIKSLTLDEISPSISVYPYLGYNTINPNEMNSISESNLVSDSLINKNTRYTTLTNNIKLRRGKKVEINVHEAHTNNPISLDSMAFGMGCCCLQVTLEARNLLESLKIFDLLIPLAPILLALTASTPIIAGKQLTTDTRIKIISQSVDDRTDEELKSVPPLTSRYSGITNYLLESHSEYNIPLFYNKDIFNELRNNKIPINISKHVANIISRDNLIVYEHQIKSGNIQCNNSYTNLLSTVWQFVRWKLPNKTDNTWRVEFRPMEIQLTDIENSAFILFVVLYVKANLYYNKSKAIPINQVKINIDKSEKYDGVLKEEFFWKKNELIQELPIFDIIECEFKLIEQYLDESKTDILIINQFKKYKRVILNKAYGIRPTCAKWIRNFLQKTKLESQDKVIYDLLNKCHSIGCENKLEY